MASVILKVNCDHLRLLPIWLDYHKHIFHSGKAEIYSEIYREDVTQLVKRFCPTWEIVDAYQNNSNSKRTLSLSVNEFILEPFTFTFDRAYTIHKMHLTFAESSSHVTRSKSFTDSFPNNIVEFLDNISDNGDGVPIVFLCNNITSPAIINQLIRQTRNKLAKTDYIYYLDAYIHSNYDWGEDRVILFEDTNLLEYTNFNPDGHAIYKMTPYNTFLQNMVKSKIEKIAATITSQQINLDLEKYHLHVTDEEHTNIINAMPWKKTESSELQEFAKYMEHTVSEILERKVKIFNDDIWVRICRPSSVTETDYNPCHRDIYLDFYKNIVNIYVPIVGSNEMSSLAMQSGSHYWNERDTTVTKGGAYFPNTGKKYSVDAVLRSRQPLNMIRPNPREDEFILFSPYLIHGCSSNENPDMTRMSLEIRFIEDTDAGRKQESDFREFLAKRVWR